MSGTVTANTIGFEEFSEPPYSQGPESYYDGSDLAGGFTSGDAFFNNTFTDFGGGFTAWSGWAVSNTTDTTTPGFANQYSAFPGAGAADSTFYGVAYAPELGDAYIDLPTDMAPVSARIANTTYAALAMRDGDAFSKKFGGETGDDPDFFSLTISGYDDGRTRIGTVDFYLADYRFADNAQDYIVDDWIEVDLAPLVGATTLEFELQSSDVGQFGLNTPAYFALDQLSVVPEPATLVLCIASAIGALRKRG